MERKHLSTRLLSYLLTFAMLLSFAVPVGAVEPCIYAQH